MSEMPAWSCSEFLGQRSWLVSKSHQGSSLPGRDPSRVLQPGVSNGALLGNQRVSLPTCQLQINEGVDFLFFFLIARLTSGGKKKKNHPQTNHIYAKFMQPPNPPKHFCRVKDQNGARATPHFSSEAVLSEKWFCWSKWKKKNNQCFKKWNCSYFSHFFSCLKAWLLKSCWHWKALMENFN